MSSFYKLRGSDEVFEDAYGTSLKFLYRNFFGRILIKLFSKRFISKLGGLYLKSSLSKGMINKTVRLKNINMNDYEEVDYKSFNDFFIRKIKAEARNVDMNYDSFISPCDSKLSVYKIKSNLTFEIKDSHYSVSSLLNNSELSSKYNNGYILIFRLVPSDYHRYSYIDDGSKSKNVRIKGVFHTVQSIALEKHNIYKMNEREYTILHTDNFDDVVHIEVGALMVGKIVNYHNEYYFRKGEEKGYFEFGGSTICLLVKENIINIDEDILKNSSEGYETVVKYGEKIGSKISN